MMQNLTYRELNKKDIPIVTEYRILFLRELQGEQTLEIELKLRNELVNYFEIAFADNTFTGIIAEIQDHPVGFGGMVIQQIPGNFEIMHGLEGYILNMYTLPEYRKRGIAREIFNRLVTKGKDLGLDKIYLHASEDGIELYRQCGFKEPTLPVLELLIPDTGR